MAKTKDQSLHQSYRLWPSPRLEVAAEAVVVALGEALAKVEATTFAKATLPLYVDHDSMI